MLKIWRWLALLYSLILAIMPAIPVLAGSSSVVSIYAKGIATTGITDFTITYVTDTRLDFSWLYGGNVTNVMLRGAYGHYPNDITASNETPSDGWLVYYGPANSASDTTVDLANNAGRYYYKIWAQLNDGSWQTIPATGWEESTMLTLLVIFGLAVAITLISLKTSFYVWKFVAGLAWWGAAAYWIAYRPSAIAAGSAPDVIIILVLIVAGLGVGLMPFWYTTQENGQEMGRGFRFPFMRTPEQEERDNYRSTHSERSRAYSDRVYGAMNGRRLPRRQP